MRNIEEILKEANAWHEGHTEFRNGMHGDGWLQKDLIARDPKYLDQVARLQADQIMREFPEVELIMGPVTGGALIASNVARHLGKEMGIIDGKKDPVVFHDMNIPEAGEKVVMVEDIISSGVDMGRFTRFLKQSGAEILGICVWMNRKGSEIENIKVSSLLETPFKLYQKEECPLCAQGVEIKYKNVRE